MIRAISPFSGFLFCVALLGIAGPADANSQYDYDWSDPNQPNEGCGHIALVDVLDYWDSKYPGLVPAELEPDTGENQADKLSQELQKDKYLGPGIVHNDDMWQGIKDWFKDHGVGLRSKQQGAYEGEIPSWDFYKSEIDKGEKVLILIQWDGEGHWLPGFSAEDGKFNVHDPNEPGRNTQQYGFTKGSDGYLHVSYTLDDETVDAKITQMISVTAIPEPSVALLGLIGVAALMLKRR